MKHRRPIRIVIADDHRVFAQGLAVLLESKGLVAIAVTNDRDELPALILQHAPDVAIVDLSMPGMSIVDLLAVFCKCSSAPRLLVLTANDNPQIAKELLDAGVHGYLLKEHAFEEIVVGIRAVASNRLFVSPQLAGRMLSNQTNGAPQLDLTARQLEVLRLVAKGHTSKRIAGKLGIQATTVDKHRDHIRAKLGVRSAAEMIHVASERGLI